MTSKVNKREGSFYPMKAESLMARYGENWDSKTKCTVMIAMAVSERKVSSFASTCGMWHTFRTANWIQQWRGAKRQWQSPWRNTIVHHKPIAFLHLQIFIDNEQIMIGLFQGWFHFWWKNGAKNTRDKIQSGKLKHTVVKIKFLNKNTLVYAILS